MLTELQEKWLTALESGNYAQGTGMLLSARGYCCLGIACEVMGFEKGNESFKFENNVLLATLCCDSYKLMGLRDSYGTFKIPIKLNNMRYGGLTCMNDRGVAFKDIANYVRSEPENVFSESLC